MSTPATNPSRRAFLQRVSALGAAGAAAPLALNLAALGEAAAATASDYKALVCIFLYGGNDHANTLPPYDAQHHAAYLAQRPSMAHARASLDATALNASTPALDREGAACQYALAPALAPLLPLWQSAQLATLLNVGPLMQPTTKAQYTAKSVALPPKLFSHNDQQSVWQSSLSEGATSGWGGRMGDLFEAGNGRATFTCVSVSGNAVFLSGRSAVQYQVSSSGSVALNALRNPLFGSRAASDALRSMITAARTHLMEAEHTRVVSRAIDAHETLTTALARATPFNTSFPAGNGLTAQLQMVARMISAADELQAKRQVFLVSLGGFDTHDNLTTTHPELLATVASAMASFQSAMNDLGVARQVTAFTASDFGRTLTGNTDGSDHGWGSMHFLMGGAVQGGRHYGVPPVFANGGPDDVGQGRLIPTTSVEQMAATLGSWFGLSDPQVLELLPHLAQWNPSQRNLRFV
jgi:uncharacterized protein (DUF1501 family)